MPFQLGAFSDIALDEPLLRLLLDEHAGSQRPQLERLWAYYRNPASSACATGGRPRLAQEDGLPARLRGVRSPLEDDRAGARREVVIENDIAWRLHAMVDFMLGRPIGLVSGARDEATRAAIEAILDAAFEASGGGALLQDMALLASVYGHIDLLLRADALFDSGRAAAASAERAIDLARLLRVELIEPTRAVPIVSPHDYRRLDGMVIRFTRAAGATDATDDRRGPAAPALARALSRLGLPAARRRRATVDVVEILSARRRQVYEDERLVFDGPNPLAELPVVHMQNISQPFRYEGLSEVEPLIPLQDELNTRMSDRAHRVTMQSFKMYLARGVDGFGAGGGGAAPIGPGQVWSTDNTDASVEAFGGDGASPSEDAHIEHVRQALDKASGVTPVAAGVIRAKVGQLSSESALRVTLMGMLAKTARKQATFGRGVAEVARLILVALDRAGVFPTDPADRAVRVRWPDPMPRTERELLDAALTKRQLGVPEDRLLAELGYAPTDPGVA